MYLNISGMKNIEVIALINNIKDKDYIDEMIKFVGLKDRINDKVKKYSFSNKYGSPYMWGIAIIIALMIAYIRLRREKNKLKLVSDSLDASAYFVDKEIENQKDIFSHTTTQVIHDRSSSGGGIRSSGGSRHSGGGRRF